jgi:hypothetical protein
MFRSKAVAFSAALAAGILLTTSVHHADAKGGGCVLKAAEGTGESEKTAKFQVYEALLQSVDWGAWAAWMANGTTPGYKVGAVKYHCSSGGVGVTCRGQSTICKL